MTIYPPRKRQPAVGGLCDVAPVPNPPMPSQIELLLIGEIKPYQRNPRRHDDRQIDYLVRSIREFGFLVAILIDQDNCIVAGHARFEAARRLGLKRVPTVRVEHLTPAQVKAYRIADNRSTELSEWHQNNLHLEIVDLSALEMEGDLDFDLTLTGFDTPQIDIIIENAGEPAAQEAETVELPDPALPVVTRLGDLWEPGDHRILCGDALQTECHARIMAGEEARMVFTDPPYNVPVEGHVRTGTGRGHREFLMASGEMTDAQFRAFLSEAIASMAAACMDGALLMICMDWRHTEELIAAGKGCGLTFINLCVWNKTNRGMGSLYRSKHELVGVFKKGKAPHVNNVELGRHGRYRTNVWDYAGVNTFRQGRAADLVDHPTVKPTALVADAIRDVSHRGEIVLDPFGGSGSTLLAAEKSGRRARLIELDPTYVDVAIRRWQALTGHEAVLETTGETFAAREAAVADTGSRDATVQGGLNHG
jgi:DNA modification methylase